MASTKTDVGRAAGPGSGCTAHFAKQRTCAAFAVKEKFPYVELLAMLGTLLPGTCTTCGHVL